MTIRPADPFASEYPKVDMSLVMTLSATLACPVDCTRVTSRPSPIAGNLGLLNSAGRPPTQLATRPQSRLYRTVHTRAFTSVCFQSSRFFKAAIQHVGFLKKQESREAVVVVRDKKPTK